MNNVAMLGELQRLRKQVGQMQRQVSHARSEAAALQERLQAAEGKIAEIETKAPATGRS